MLNLRVFQHKCYIVATCDKDLKRRIRKIPGVPIMYLSQHKYVPQLCCSKLSTEVAASMSWGRLAFQAKFCRFRCVNSCVSPTAAKA